ncbi:MAG: hypothetical protein ACXW1R_07545 [Halobacteriota archaeon]
MANFCTNCGKKLSFLERHDNDTLCSECSNARTNAHQAQLANLEQSIAASRTATPEQLALLKTYEHKTVLDLYFRLYNTFVADKELDEQDIAKLGEVQQAGGLTNQEVRFEELVRPYCFVSTIRTEGKLPTIHLTVEGAGPVILHKGEVVHYAHEATLNEITRVSLGYKGSSHGVSIPLPFKIGGSPIRYRVGQSRGHIVSEDRLTQTSAGVLVVTNQRIVLQPAPGNKPVSIPLTKVLSYNCYNNGIEVYKEGREKGYFFSVKDSGAVELFGICLGFLLGSSTE